MSPWTITHGVLVNSRRPLPAVPTLTSPAGAGRGLGGRDTEPCPPSCRVPVESLVCAAWTATDARTLVHRRRIHRHDQRKNRNMGMLDRGRKIAKAVTDQDRAETDPEAASALSSSSAFGEAS